MVFHMIFQNAYLFNVKMILEWSMKFVPMLTTELLRLSQDMRENKHLIEQSWSILCLPKGCTNKA